MILEKIKKIYYRRIGKYLIKDIGRLEWTPEDFRAGKKWAMTKPHPCNKKLNLWDYLKTYGESTLIINEINKINKKINFSDENGSHNEDPSKKNIE